MNTPRYILIHCTDYSYRKMKDQFLACNNWHRDRQFPVSSKGLFIGYHRLITGGKNYECRLDTDEGAHCNQRINGVSLNFQSLGVCLGFDGDIELPIPEEYSLLQKQVWEWQDKYKIPNDKVVFHRYFAKDKTCPGSLITNQWLKDLLTRPQPIKEEIKLNQCIDEKKTIEELNKKVSWYESLINSLRNLLANK